MAAWADEEIQRWTAVPAPRDVPAAERWIAGDDDRRARWLSVDLVVVRDALVVGEVGLAAFDRIAGTAEAGWWTAGSHRGEGIASVAVGLVVRWALVDVGLTTIIARCQVANAAAVAVARRAGFEVTSSDDGEVLLSAR